MSSLNRVFNFLGSGGSAFLELLIAVVIVLLIVLAFRARQALLAFGNELYASWTVISQFGKHLILAVALAIAVALIGFGCGLFAKSEARTWLCEYDADLYRECPELMAAATTDLPSPTPTPTPAPPATPTPLTVEERSRLEAQAEKVRGLKRHHASVMAFFSQAYYTAICVLLFGGAVLALAMFFIGTKGWGQTNPYVRTVFVVMAVMVAFYGLWPPVFQQEKNLSDNKALFLEYETLQNEISSYNVTRTNIKNEPKTPGDFINYVDSEMARLGNVAIGFDYTKISYKGAFESSSSSTAQPTPSPLPSASPKKPG
ncbi:MAG TPA: hypothetical protein VKD91_01390 [Pyrinomonadaceae bacterium]|nr:hypothetical protein [Pyrinomonadaceae bacterium]